MSKEPIPRSVANAWSGLINGISARLCVELEDLKPGLRHAIYLEIRNHSQHPIALTNQPQIQAKLLDSSGKAVSTSGIWISGPIPDPQWAVVPRDAYIGFRIDMQTVGVPTREHGRALIAVGGEAWEVRSGRYMLNVALLFERKEDGPPNQWVGELELPPVEVVLTPDMLG